MEKTHKKQAKPTGPDVGNKHGTVIVTRFRPIVKVAFGTALQHLKGFYKRPTAGFEGLAFVATGTFGKKNAV